MKKLSILLIVAILAVSCKPETKSISKKAEKFPEVLGKIIQTHGGIDTWRAAKTLSFNKGEEAHTADLVSRKTIVISPKYSMGYNGKEVWLYEKDSGTYKGNPKFYHNLYFYFYAMPFVLADDGIIYEDAASITFKGREYPGIKISYEANVGTSPDDNYIIYYDKESLKMQWLAYTVTFNSKEPSEKYNLIRYNNWEDVNGLQLPKSITWYKKDEKGQPTEPARPATEFIYPLVSNIKLDDSFFEKSTVENM